MNKPLPGINNKELYKSARVAATSTKAPNLIKKAKRELTQTEYF